MKSWTRYSLFSLLVLSFPLGAVPRVFREGDGVVKRVSCELYLSADRTETLRQLLSGRRLTSLEGQPEFDITGILHDLAGVGYPLVDRPLHEIERLRELVGHFGALTVGPLLNTPISRLAEIDRRVHFFGGEKIVDIGSGHGAPAFYFATLYPDTHWLGLELSAEKVRAAQKVAAFLGLRNADFEVRDFSDPRFQLPEADTYYLMNPVHGEILQKLLRQLREIARRRPIRIIGLGIADALTGLDRQWLEVERDPKDPNVRDLKDPNVRDPKDPYIVILKSLF